jgi:hypothetical protein
MTEIRASVTVEVHRKLKEEAARSGRHLKDLVADLLQTHVVKNASGNGKGQSAKKGR